MTGYLTNDESSYLLIPKKYLSRYILTYEVILSSLCVKVNNKTLLNFSESRAIIYNGLLDNAYCLLELSCRDIKVAYSLTCLNKIWFSDDEAKEAFIANGYENFNVESLCCKVVGPVSHSNILVIDVDPPKSISKIDFASMMMLDDGIMAMFYERLKDGADLDDIKLILHSDYSKLDLLGVLINIHTHDEVDISVLNHFIMLCLDNGVDVGWDASEVLESLTSLLPENIVVQNKYTQWKALAQAFVNNENVPEKLFTDPEDGSIVLRAIILVLLNPEYSSLKALKENNVLYIGAQVYKAAKAFISLRSGYSLYNYEQRDAIGINRKWLQNLNADLHNDEFYYGKSLIDTSSEVNDILTVYSEVKNFDLLDYDFLTASIDKINGYQVYEINGVIPSSGFRMSLLLDIKSTYFSLWIVDLRTSAGQKKFKGKLALDLIQIQSNFEQDFRFEVTCDGLYLRTPVKCGNSDLKPMLKGVLNKMSLLKLLNSRKTTF